MNVLGAAFLAAAGHEPIAMRHLTMAAQREFEKMGKLWSAPPGIVPGGGGSGGVEGHASG